MSITTMIIIYLCFCMQYRFRQLNHIFILRSLQTLKISKHRDEINLKIIRHEKRFKWFLFWPLIDLYEWYEDWKTNRDRNAKSKTTE